MKKHNLFIDAKGKPYSLEGDCHGMICAKVVEGVRFALFTRTRKLYHPLAERKRDETFRFLEVTEVCFNNYVEFLKSGKEYKYSEASREAS